MVGKMYMIYISIENMEPNSVFSLRHFHYHISAFLTSIMTNIGTLYLIQSGLR